MRWARRTWLTVATAGVVALGLSLGATGCGASPAAASAPVLNVVTADYPLADAIDQIGQGKVRVTDVFPPGADPRATVLTPSQAAQVRAAQLVVDVGGGFQPPFEQAAAGAPTTVALLPAVGGGNPYIWLDPVTMERATTVIASALTRANPAAGSTYSNGARDFSDVLSSLGIDYQNTLSDCPHHTLFTANGAFSGLASRYGLVDHPIGGSLSPAEVQRGAAAITASQVGTVFSQPWVSSAAVTAAAHAAHVKVRLLNTLEGAPAGGWPKPASYFNLMEANLGAISRGLQCAQMGP
jgi:ABC-type Zn uptake system ZnuABC Zn-binding protein ZnuA